MKNLLFILALIPLFACVKEDEEICEMNERTPVEFYGNVLQIPKILPSTKSTSYVFSRGDSIGIFEYHSTDEFSQSTIMDNVINYIYKATTGALSATFIPAGTDTIAFIGGQTVSFISYYPAVTDLSSDWVIPIDLSDQNSSNIFKKDLLYSNNAVNKEQNPVNLEFNHKLSAISFYIAAENGISWDDLQIMTVSLRNVSTSADFSLINDTITNYGASTDTLPLVCTTYYANQALTAEGFIIPNSNNANTQLAITINSTHPVTYTYDLPEQQVYKSGYYYYYTVSLSYQAGSVTGSINYWQEGTTINGGNIVIGQ